MVVEVVQAPQSKHPMLIFKATQLIRCPQGLVAAIAGILIYAIAVAVTAVVPTDPVLLSLWPPANLYHGLPQTWPATSTPLLRGGMCTFMFGERVVKRFAPFGRPLFSLSNRKRVLAFWVRFYFFASVRYMGTVTRSMVTVLQVATLDSWADIVRPLPLDSNRNQRPGVSFCGVPMFGGFNGKPEGKQKKKKITFLEGPPKKTDTATG